MVLKNKFGQDISDELNTLYAEGYIIKAEGVNAPLIKLIKFE